MHNLGLKRAGPPNLCSRLNGSEGFQQVFPNADYRVVPDYVPAVVLCVREPAIQDTLQPWIRARILGHLRLARSPVESTVWADNEARPYR
jgi:hypothetical protein